MRSPIAPGGMPFFRQFCVFAAEQVRSGDIDPMYPVLKRSYELEDVPPDVAAWRTVLYVTWYHVGSAETVWRRAPEPRRLTPEDVLGLPTGIERRAFRGNARAAEFVNSLLFVANGGQERTLDEWLDSFGEGERGWDAARSAMREVKYGGPWASYKFADLVKHVHDRPITASDIGVGGAGETAGPIPGMVRITGRDWKECAGDVALQRHLLQAALDEGVPFDGLDQLETALCDFNSLCKGSYYVGLDIDDQQTKLAQIHSPSFWQARDVFPPQYRGEIGGWTGVDKERRRAFRDQGRILFR